MNFKNTIKQICDNNGIKCTFLSKNWIIKLEKGDKIGFITGNKFDLNSHALGNILDDKYAFYEVLKNDNVPIIEHKILYKSDNNNEYAKGCNSYENALDYFISNNQNIVIKANNGACGKEVFHITNTKDLYKTLDKLFINNYSISMCPFYNIKNEYRAVVLNNNIKFIYGKTKPVVIGDGKHTLKELLVDFNPNYFKNKDIKYIIPKNKEVIEYDWRFNLSNGSIGFTNISNDLIKRIEKLIYSVLDVTNIRFSNIDVIELYNGELLVMEANSGVTLDKICNFIESDNNIVYNIYEEAIKYMMEE